MSYRTPVQRLQQRQYTARELAEAIAFFSSQIDSYDELRQRFYRRSIKAMSRWLEEERQIIAASVIDWFYPQDNGPYAVHSVGEAGVVREEFSGFHYPFQAVAKALELYAASTGREVFLAVNVEDPESSVEREDEAYWVDFPRLCSEDNDKLCVLGCSEFDCAKVPA